MSRFCFVESNTTGTGALAVERLLAAGHAVVFVTRAPEKYPFLATPAPGLSVLVTETNDIAALLAELRALAAREPLDALLSFSDFYVVYAAQAARALGLRGLDPEAAARCRDKYLTRTTLRQAGLPTPAFQLLRGRAEAEQCAAQVSYPCIVKPRGDSSSHGVVQVHDAAELLTHYGELAAWGRNVRGQAVDGSVLVESLLVGPEYSVETFTTADGHTHVVGVTDKHLSPPPLFVEVGHDFPSRAPAELRAQVAAAAVQALAAVGFDCGPAHTEVRLTPQGAVVVEINPRLAGGMIPELVAHALGVDLVQAWFDHLLGRPVDLSARRHDWASLRFLLAEREGRLDGVEGLESARALADVRAISVASQPGARVRPARDAYDRLGFVLAAGPSAAGCAEAAERARSLIRLDIAPAVAA